MNKIFILFSFLISFNFYAQSDIKAKLQPIKNNYKRINSIKKWKNIKKIELFHSSEGGEAILYLSDNGLEKVTATYYGETGKMTTEYYLDDYQKLSFVFEVITDYKMHISQENFTTDNAEITEIRNYFSDGLLIKQIHSKKDKTATENYLKTETIRIDSGFINLLIETLNQKYKNHDRN